MDIEWNLLTVWLGKPLLINRWPSCCTESPILRPSRELQIIFTEEINSTARSPYEKSVPYSTQLVDASIDARRISETLIRFCGIFCSM